MSLNDWKEDGRPKQMGDQEKPLNDGTAAESQQDVIFGITIKTVLLKTKLRLWLTR